MESWELNDYQKRVRNCLQELRVHCFGFNTPISTILPKEAESLANEKKAELITWQILFQAASTDDSYTTEELEHTKHWVYTITRYLFEECNSIDQTFHGFEQLLKTEQHIRALLFQKAWAHPDIREDKHPPSPLRNLDTVFLQLLNANKLLDDGVYLSKQLQLLL